MAGRHRTRGRGRLWGALVACGLVIAVAVPGAVGGGSALAQGGPYTVTVAPTTDISDGRQLNINVKTDAANANPIYSAQAYVCRPGVTYLPGDVDRPSVEGRQGGPNCPPIPLSTSAQPNAVSSRTFDFAPTAEGENLYLRVGVGVVEWTDAASGGTNRLACDPSNPCVLVVQLQTDAGFIPFQFDLAFRTTDAIQSCGGAAPGALVGAGSDALSDAWVGWTIATCAQAGTGAWSTLALGEESAAVERFAESEIDIAYTALGYNEQAGFVSDVASPRGAVAVPIGISATTLGIGNGWNDASSRKRPFSQATMTLDDVTTLLAGGEVPFRERAGTIAARNPELAGDGFMVVSDRTLKVGAPAEAGITPWAFTRHFDTLRPDLWRVPNLPFFPEAGQPRGVDASFPLASPSYANVLTTLTGRPALARALGGLGPFDIGGIWVFTDLTTAASFDLAPVALENAGGEFVAPNNESLAAAVATMETTTDGMRVPNPAATTGYPLTYVVYAMVPAQPLTDLGTGACRTDSQQLLADWLTYVVRDGQGNVPAGLVPLTPELQAEAEAALQQVGQTPGEPCPVPVIPPPPGTPPAPVAASVAGTSDASGSGGPVSASPAGAATAATDANDAVEQANAELTVSESDDPGFFGGTLPSLLAAVGALLGIGGLTALAAKQTGRRALPPGPEMTRLPPPPDAAIGP